MSIRKAERPKTLYGTYVDDIRDFIESGWDCAEVDVSGTSATNACQAIRRNLERHAEFSSVRVRKHGERVLLVLDEVSR